jgi:TRAP-type transport system periplasmic protein
MSRSRGFTALALLAALTAGCAGGGSQQADKSGGVAAGNVVLSLASTAPDISDSPPVDYFVRRVAQLSNGALRVRILTQWGDLAPDSEAQVVRGVAGGQADLGWAGSRVFDTLGASSFRALSAPLLIDSYPLERLVLNSDMSVRMLASIAALHVSPLAMLADGLRHPVAVHRPLLTAADWRGLAFGGYRSATQQRAVKALHARPVVAFAAIRLHDLETGQIQGFELDLRRYDRTYLPLHARYLTANVNLWPEFDILFANPHRFSSLNSQQQAWLQEAAKEATTASLALTSRDHFWARKACAFGAHFVNATPADLTSLRQAFRPVYHWLERSAQTKRFIEQIRSLKRSLAARPSAVSHLPAGCTR